ncbi:SIR2 family protein [Desulfovibrio sp. JY]|nr:SIR2 family protein [Desulfovibrio sp. JY]
MQFVKDGPDIPEVLLQAQEEGKVVFFCGAGISYPAGLPDFKGLVDSIYNELGTNPYDDDREKEAYENNRFDTTLDLLEHRIPGQRLVVRKAIFSVLKPNFRRKIATETHRALLQLSNDRKGATRLVTTNFDRIFERVRKKYKLSISAYPAPFLPIPKNSRWNGVVYLHGLLPEANDEYALNRLVVTSGDFGLAYLTERWAARFVSELFRHYIVCFVGYSINDPVLRYMMDALAADRMMGESMSRSYALGDFASGAEKEKEIEWKAKGVVPILYKVPTGTNDHSALHRTLKAWAGTYRDGVLGNERIVSEYALTRPMASTPQDDFVGRMLWALSDSSGLPAKHFATFNPVPSLDWLKPLIEDRYCHFDLPRFGVMPQSSEDSALCFSFAQRPAPYSLAPFMMLLKCSKMGSQWDAVMHHIAHWLIRHLDNPKLVLWLASNGGKLHEDFIYLVVNRLNDISSLEHNDKIDELQNIRINAPDAIPRPIMRSIWNLLLAGRIKSPWNRTDLYLWKKRFNCDGLTPTLRLELRKLLSPCISLKKPFVWSEDIEDNNSANDFKRQLTWELVLASDHVYLTLCEKVECGKWKDSLPLLLNEFEQLLRDALDILHELGDADSMFDRSYLDLPSVSPHSQNGRHRDWVALVELLRDAWLVLREQNLSQAIHVASEWWLQPYPVFKRLALFAASQGDISSHIGWVDWLLADEGWWLWSVETKREVLRLLVLQGIRLTDVVRERLELGILAGPPRMMYRDEITPEDWQWNVDHSIWLRLAKLSSSGVMLGKEAALQIARLKINNPKWELAINESDEFPFWISGTGDPDYEERRVVERVPRQRNELVDWLRRPPFQGPLHEDDWREYCQKKCPTAIYGLCVLAHEQRWPSDRWREALQAWDDGKLICFSWKHVALLLKQMPDAVLLKIAHAASCWLENVSNVLDSYEDIFLEICLRFLDMPSLYDSDTEDVVSDSINHPVGHITKALLNLWLQRKPQDQQGLPADLVSIFTKLCDVDVYIYRHARLLLAARVITFFRVDSQWTIKNILPLFDWNVSQREAQSAWKGYLWSPRLYWPLFAEIKYNFIETAQHYTDLGDYGRQYAAIITYAALGQTDTFSLKELHGAICSLPQEGLVESARALLYSLNGAGNQREMHFVNRIQLFWQMLWPKSHEKISPVLAEVLVQLVIASGDMFPRALGTLRDWLVPIEYPHYVVSLLQESSHCDKFPQDSLELLTAIIANQPWPSQELSNCLAAVAKAWPEARQDTRFQRLAEYIRRYGSE